MRSSGSPRSTPTRSAGPAGITPIPHPPPLFGVEFLLDPLPYYYLILFFIVLAIIFSLRLQRSRVGRAWTAIREDEDAAELMGVPTFKFKLLAFAIGAMIGGLAGTIFASKVIFIAPTNFPFILSATILAAVLLGGAGNLPGVILGAFLIAWLPERFRGFADYRILVFGAALVLTMTLRPQGLLPSRQRSAEFKEGTGGSLGGLGAEVPPTAPTPRRGRPMSTGGGDATDASVARRRRRPADRRPGARRRHDALRRCRRAARGAICRCARARSSRSSARTVPARPPCSTSSPACSGRPRVQVRFDGHPDRRHEAVQGHAGRRRPHVPEHPAVPQHDRRGERHGRGGRPPPHRARSARPWGCGWHRREEREGREQAQELLDFVGISMRAGEAAKNLPYGDQRRLEIARALATDPRLLLLDEPAAGMNPAEKQSLQELIRKIRDSGRTVLLIEHDMGLVMDISDRIAVLDFGEMIAEGLPARGAAQPEGHRGLPGSAQCYLRSPTSRSTTARSPR